MKYYRHSVLSSVMLLFFSMMIFNSCNHSKKHFSDAKFEVVSLQDLPTVYMNGTLFTGTLWSNDDQTMSMEVENGKVETFTLYHMNGKIANIQYGSHVPASNFDENGNSLSEYELDAKYPHLREATNRILQKEIMPNIIEKNK